MTGHQYRASEEWSEQDLGGIILAEDQMRRDSKLVKIRVLNRNPRLEQRGMNNL